MADAFLQALGRQLARHYGGQVTIPSGVVGGAELLRVLHALAIARSGKRRRA
jgi:hypothetical protein